LGERYLLAVPSKTLIRDVEAALPEYLDVADIPRIAVGGETSFFLPAKAFSGASIATNEA
jgi:hypothetical protein